MTKKFQLKNGLTVILIESNKSPVISAQMWVKTGSADESLPEAGISHFIEHLVFKGTDKFKVGEIASYVEASGGELNAYTSFDQTVFYVTISSEFKDVALDVISQMMGYPQFDPQEIDNEREVVIEEIKRGQDNPGRASSQQLFSMLFKKHPYGRPVIGYEKVIKKVSPKTILRYFNERYVPRNMTLVIAGDFKSPQMKESVQKYFGGFTDYKLKKVKRIKEKPSKKVEIKVTKQPFNQNSIYLAWHGPSVVHKDVAALEVMASILGQSETSRLIKSLRIDSAVVNSIGSFVYPMQDHGLFAVSCSLEKQNLELALQKIKEELAQFILQGPTAEEMQRAITNIAATEFYSVDTVDSLARKAGSYHFYLNDHQYFMKYIKQIYKLKPEDIRKVAKKYLDPDRIKISSTISSEPEYFKKHLKIFAKELKKALSQKHKLSEKPKKFKAIKLRATASVANKDAEIKELSFENGLQLILKPQAGSPTVVSKLAMLGGQRSESEAAPGSVELFSRVWGSSTQKLNEYEIGKILDNHAAGISAFGGRNSVGISMECLSGFENKISDLFVSMICEPKFDEAILQREAGILKNQISKKNDNPAQICMLNFQKRIFEGHPYSRDPMGTVDSVDAVSTDTIEQYFKKVTGANNATLCVVGDFSEKHWIEVAKHLDKTLGKKQRLNQKHHLKDLSQDVIDFAELQKEQSHIVVGYRGLSLFAHERFALDVIQSILSGQGGRLFLELRDKNSLAYSVAPLMLTGFDGGYFGGYIGCSPEKGQKAIEMLKAEFQKLANEKVSAKELLRAQKYLIGRHDIDLQRKASVCNSMLFDQIYGFDPKKSLKVSDDYFSVSQDEIVDLAQKIFAAKSVISIVGPKNPLKG
ncbi:MAG: M16 family metallopeptidase [Bdellovibrionia bacterium]